MYSDTLIQTQKPIGAPASDGTRGRLARALTPIQKIALNMFGLDYRSLALMRIAMALCLLWVTYSHACGMRAFYTDDGVLPRQALFDNPPDYLGFSLHFADGGMPYIATLFAIQFVLAFMMLVGYRTRLATLGSYILLFSMQNRQPILIFGGDIVLRVGLFWSIFLPLSKRYSVDRMTGRTGPAPNRPYLGIAGIGFIVQTCSIYVAGALMKTGPTWQVDHTAVAYALVLDVYSRPLGRWLLQYDALTRLLTIVTLKLELYGPLLFILPVFSKWGRMLGLVLFTGLQLGFGLCMTLWYFGPAMVTLTLVFLPPFFWERVGEPCGRWLARKFGGIKALGKTRLAAWPRKWMERERAGNTPIIPLPPRVVWCGGFVLALARDGFLAVLIVVVVLWNVGNLPDQPWRLSPKLGDLADTVGLNQTWDMFSPDPETTDGWFVVAGTLRNGRTVDLMTGASPVTYDKPASVPQSFGSQLWMCYLISFWYPGASSPQYFAQYLGTTWNEHHSGDEQIRSIEIDEMSETVLDGPSESDPARVFIWAEWF